MRDSFDRRKRISLTEEELALGSWLYLTYRIIMDDTWDDIFTGKEIYLGAHGFHFYKWRNACILCAKHINYTIHSCGHCPLKRAQRNKGVKTVDWCGCGNNSWYEKVCGVFPHSERISSAINFWDEKVCGVFLHSERISSAINICNVLAEELKKARRK